LDILGLIRYPSTTQSPDRRATAGNRIEEQLMHLATRLTSPLDVRGARKTRGLAFAAACLALGLAGCPDSGKKPAGCKTGDFSCVDIPDIELVPGEPILEIVDAGLQPGDTVQRTIRVINVGATTLKLTNVDLEYSPPSGAVDGTTPAFKLQPLPISLPFGIEVSGGDTFPQGVDIVIEYTKGNDTLARNAKLVLKSSDPLQPTLEVAITTAVGIPVLAASPNPVDFGLVPENTVEPMTLRLLNTGTRDLQVSGFQIARDGRFGFMGDGFEAEGSDAVAGVDLETPIVVPEGEAREIKVTFRSDSPLPAEGELIIYSDDPLSGANGYRVNLVANKSGPCITVNPKKIVFGGKVVGAQSIIDFEIESCGTEALKVSNLVFGDGSSPDFTLDFSRLPEGFSSGPNAANVLSIPINTKVTVGVIFVPDAVNPRDPDNVPIPDEGVVVVSSNGFDSTAEIPVSGAGAESACPTPVITVREGEEVIPQTVVHISSRESFAPFGSISDVQWTITEPAGTPKPQFLPSPTTPEPVVELNSVGLYTFTLQVRDEFGNRSGSVECPNTTYDVLVQPDQAIHVELTWLTPGDSDEADTGEGEGSDLDLHFAHQNATGPDLDGDGLPDPWFDQYWDSFWFNKEPDWATLGEPRDDPHLDRDDYDGAGPENLNLSVPENGVTYRIGVHYWNDWGFGPTTATIKVFHYADEIYNVTLEDMDEHDMWSVGSIDWPVPAVRRWAPAGAPEAVTPNYVNTFFRPPL